MHVRQNEKKKACKSSGSGKLDYIRSLDTHRQEAGVRRRGVCMVVVALKTRTRELARHRMARLRVSLGITCGIYLKVVWPEKEWSGHLEVNDDVTLGNNEGAFGPAEGLIFVL